MEGGPPVFGQDCTCPALLEDRRLRFPYGAVTRSGPPFQTVPVRKPTAAGLVRVRSPLLAESRLMSFPPATEMFQFAGFASRAYGFGAGSRSRGGLPHSEIPGSQSARLSPGLFAACHVLHRLSVPRHPPDALLILAFRRETRRNPDPARRAQGQAPRRRSREDTITAKRRQPPSRARPAPSQEPDDRRSAKTS